MKLSNDLAWVFIRATFIFFTVLSCRADNNTNNENGGMAIYKQNCSQCHGPNLEGGENAPALKGANFLAKWRGRPQGDLYKKIKETMPPSNPGSLSESQYQGLVELIHKVNDLVYKPAQVPMESAASGGSTAWLHNRGNAGGTGYSPLSQINEANAKRLKIAWRWQSRNFGAVPEYNFEATPLLLDGVLYTTAGIRRDVIAIDASTGETLWLYRMDEGKRGLNAPRISSGRGVAIFKKGSRTFVYVITPGFQLVALDGKTGLPVSDFGNRGVVDLKTQIDQSFDVDAANIGSSSPPLVINDVLVVGSAFAGGMMPPSKTSVKGAIIGFDATSGKRLWIFHSIPQAGEYGNDSWLESSWTYTGNVGAWTPLSGDEKAGYAYIPMEEATGDYYGGHRPGNNLFSQSLVCLKVSSGERVWHFQTIHHGIWDYDLPAPPVLLDIKRHGKVVPVVAQVTKQGFTFVFNRLTGDPIWPIEEREVPQSNVPGEKTSLTQPFPTYPPPFERQGVSQDQLNDMTPEILAESKRMLEGFTYGPLFTPQSLITAENKGTLTLPGALGGANWPGAVADPDTGILYVSSATAPTAAGLISDSSSDMKYVAKYVPVDGPFGLPLVRPPWGSVTAIDLNTGKKLWAVANSDTPKEIQEHPLLKGKNIAPTGYPGQAKLLVTKSLLFAGGGGAGFFHKAADPVLRVLNKATGAVIYDFKLPAPATGMPMTYSIGNRQYIVVAVATKEYPGELIALTAE